MTYKQQYLVLLMDFIGKLFRLDMHGVSDAANDIRELTARNGGLAPIKPREVWVLITKHLLGGSVGAS